MSWAGTYLCPDLMCVLDNRHFTASCSRDLQRFTSSCASQSHGRQHIKRDPLSVLDLVALQCCCTNNVSLASSSLLMPSSQRCNQPDIEWSILCSRTRWPPKVVYMHCNSEQGHYRKKNEQMPPADLDCWFSVLCSGQCSVTSYAKVEEC